MLNQAGRTPMYGWVRLSVNASGRAHVVTLTDGTGDECGDDVIATVADDLWYRWLPSDRFPAPVDVIQPVTLDGARN